MSTLIDSYDKSDSPKIQLYDNSFLIKGIDNLSFRSFDFNDVKEVRYYDPNNNWWTKIYLILATLRNPIYLKAEKYRFLKIYKTNGGTWNYVMPYKVDLEFINILKLIEKTANKNLLKISD